MFLPQFRLKTAVQRFLCELQELRDFAADHPVREMRKRALADTTDYITDHMDSAIGVYTPRQLLDLALDAVDGDGQFVEFGVFRGGSIRYIASRAPNKIIHGFDSFEGLPERWTGYNMEKGKFAMGGHLPRVPDNVRLHKGWFDATLPAWLAANPGPIAFCHIDCDLYTSTKTAFDLLAPRMRPGTVIAFDEYFGYPSWRKHEFRAFQEFAATHNVTYEYLAYSRIQVALRLSAIGAAPAG